MSNDLIAFELMAVKASTLLSANYIYNCLTGLDFHSVHDIENNPTLAYFLRFCNYFANDVASLSARPPLLCRTRSVGSRTSTKHKLILAAILGLYRDNGKENGNYYSILGAYRDNGKENGSYYSIEYGRLVSYKGPMLLCCFLVPWVP